MKLNCFICSHLSHYRYITIKQALSSLDSNMYNLNVYISFSYNEDITQEMIDKLINDSKFFKYLNITWHQQNKQMFQFEHLKYIIDNNNINDNEWIMFQDDDDLSMNNRINKFIECYSCAFKQIHVLKENCNNSFDYYDSIGLVIERTDQITEKINNNILSKDYKRDFATKIVKYNLITNFFNTYKDKIKYERTTDCMFTIYLNNYKCFNDDNITYIIRSRMFSTDEQFIELYNKVN